MIGYGFMGRAHSNAYKRLNDFFPVEHRPVLKAVCARNRRKGASSSPTTGAMSASRPTGAKLVDAPDIDLIDIGSPNDTHYEIALAAAKSGQDDRLRKAAGDERRSRPKRWRRPSKRPASRTWCGSTTAACRPSRSPSRSSTKAASAGRSTTARRTCRTGPFRADVPQGGAALWRLDVNVAGSGVTGDLLAHSIDTAMWLNGPITRVVAKTADLRQRSASTPSRGKVEPVGIDDACMFLAEFANGSMGTFESTRYARGRKNFNTFELNGADGSVYFDLEEPEYLQFFEYTQQQSGKKTESHLTGWRKIHTTNSEHPYMNRYWVPGTTIGYEHTFLNALADFVDGHRERQAGAARFPQRAADAAGLRRGARVGALRQVDGYRRQPLTP